MFAAELSTKISSAQRQYLLRHIDTRVPFNCRSERGTVLSLLKLKLIRDPSPSKTTFPTSTVLTELGREVVAALLAEYAETLIRAGCLEVDEEVAREVRPLDIARRLKGKWRKTENEGFKLTTPGKSASLRDSD